jgi:hypothetical protein
MYSDIAETFAAKLRRGEPMAVISMEDIVSVQPLEFYRPESIIFSVIKDGKVVGRLIPEQMLQRKPKLRQKIGG